LRSRAEFLTACGGLAVPHSALGFTHHIPRFSMMRFVKPQLASANLDAAPVAWMNTRRHTNS
jgi:hypothetical protein